MGFSPEAPPWTQCSTSSHMAPRPSPQAESCVSPSLWVAVYLSVGSSDHRAVRPKPQSRDSRKAKTNEVTDGPSWMRTQKNSYHRGLHFPQTEGLHPPAVHLHNPGLPACRGIPHPLSRSPLEEFCRDFSSSFRVQEAQGRRQTQQSHEQF